MCFVDFLLSFKNNTSVVCCSKTALCVVSYIKTFINEKVIFHVNQPCDFSPRISQLMVQLPHVIQITLLQM